MDWKIFYATLSAIFFAELADKTQLVGITMSARSGKPVSVILGSVCGYILVTTISVVLGTLLSRFLKPDLIRYSGGFIFLLVGALMILGKV